VNGVTKHGARLLDSLGRARHGELPEERLSTKAWLAGFTTNETLHAVFRNLCAAIFAVNSDEIPAKAFLTYFMKKGAFRNFGFCPHGTLGLVQGLADAVTAHGGEVWLESEVEALHVEDGGVRSARVRRGGAAIEVVADVVISNAGPARTVSLAGREHFAPAYLARMDRDLAPTANIAVNIASRAPLLRAPGIVTFGITRRLCNLANLTATCPELAPPGWHLASRTACRCRRSATSTSAPRSRRRCRTSATSCRFPGGPRPLDRGHARDWPAQRSIAGLDLPPETSLANLWNVGDGVREYASGGTQACAETAKLVVERVLAARGASSDDRRVEAARS
jgi:hypothetical protein